MNLKIDIIKNIDMILASLLLFSSLCLTSSRYIIIYIFIVALTAIYILKQKEKLKVHISIIWYIIVSFFICLYGLLTPYPGWFSFPYFLVICISVIELYCLFCFSNKDIYKKVMFCVELVTYFCAFYLLIRELPIFVSKFSSIVQGKDWFRLGMNSYVNPTTVAYFFGILAQFSIYDFIKSKDQKVIISIIIQFLMIILSGSKKGLILVLIPILILIIDNSIKQPRNLVKYIFFFVLSIFLIFNIPFLYNMIGYRVLDFFETIGINFIPNNSVYSQSDTSTSLRINMIIEAFDLFKKHILFGNGWNAFSALTKYRYYSHCNYVELLSSMGLFGFGLYYSIYYFLIKKIKLINKMEHKLLIISLIISLLVSDFSSITMYDTVITYFAIFILSLFIFQKSISLKSFLKKYYKRG